MTEIRLLSRRDVKRFYDRIGATLDTQAFYEAPALRELAEHLELKTCRSIVEFGCGTGRLAEELLKDQLSADGSYLGLDISDTMVALARKRLAPFGKRANVRQSGGLPRIEAGDETVDRFICTYVLDLLSEDDIKDLLQEAHRVLQPGGLLGLVSLTNGPTAISRFVSTVWIGLHWMSPWLVGGCRPISLSPFLTGPAWTIEYSNLVTSFGVPSEVVVAKRRATH